MSNWDTSKLPHLHDYLTRIGAEQLNFRKYVVREWHKKYPVEKAIITIKESDGSLFCSQADYAPTEAEMIAIAAELVSAAFPKYIEATNISQIDKTVAVGELFIFLNRKSGNIVMVQERRLKPNGDKAFFPWTLWSDGVWRAMEPDCALPFWKPDVSTHSRIMIHEGAKAAQFVHKLVLGGGLLPDGRYHPWFRELSEYEHWGMIGGAFAVQRVNYNELVEHDPLEVVYVCDNDFPGVRALTKISKAYGHTMKGIRWDKRFPESWDLADDVPKGDDFWDPDTGLFVGPSLTQFMEPATWATRMVKHPESNGKKVAVLRDEFIQQWLHCVKPEVFIHVDFPGKTWSKDEFNHKIGGFSDAKDLAALVRKENSTLGDELKYTPKMVSGLFSHQYDGRCINTYEPSKIKPLKGDATPWEEFLEHLIPDKDDRFHLSHWIAMLVSRPEQRMLYGVLLVSEMNGTGKGTLGEKILTALVGPYNASCPTAETVIDSNYNYWLAHKRLCVIHEIYAGSTSKAYNKLKSVITERLVTVNRKYQAEYICENWIHVMACSNSKRAIKLSAEDRRWFVPGVVEVKRTEEEWIKFYDWLNVFKGLEIIRWWCDEFIKKHDKIWEGAEAPMSTTKKLLIEEGYSPGQTIAANLLDILKEKIKAGELPANSIVLDKDLVGYISSQLYEGRFSDRLEKASTIRKLAKERGWLVNPKKNYVRRWNSKRWGSYLITLDENVAKAEPGLVVGEGENSLKLEPLDLTNLAGM